MRNQYGGPCYRCSEWVSPGDGHFEHHNGGWRTQHASCAIEFRGTPDPVRDAAMQAARERRDAIRAQGTGKAAQQARKRIKDRETTRCAS